MPLPLHDAADLFAEPAWVVDREARVIACNDAAVAALAMERHEVTGRSLAELVQDGATIGELVAEASASGAAGPVATKLARGGGGRGCSLTALALGGGASHHFLVVGALEPIDDAGLLAGVRCAFEELGQRLARLGVRDVPAEQGLLLVDPEGRIEYASSRMELLLGAAAGGLTGLRLPALADRLRPVDLMAEPGTPQLDRWELHTPGAPPRTLQHRIVALADETGTPAGALHAFRDVTASAERARQLDERDRELEDARSVLSQSQHLTALGELAGEVAHEFGNILQAIGLHVAALRRQPGVPEAVGRSLGAIKQAVDTGHGFTRRLLTFARDDSGRMERLDVGPVLRDVVQLFEPRILHEGRPVRLQVSIDPLPEIVGNRAKLSETFLNVLLNALDAMPEGGTIEVSALESGGEIRIAIRDSGRGMTAEERQRAFDPFFTTHRGSSGLGLSTVYGIVRAHGGSVFIESEAGRGTAVCLSFPTAEPPVLAWRATDEPAPRRLGRALVVDDHSTVREATAELLAQQGYDVARASTVTEALAALSTECFALVVTDVGLPDRSGWEITRAIKERSPETLVVLVSGWGSQLSAGEARARGADLVFEKPVDPEELIAAIRRSPGAPPGARAAG